ncbi:MAG: hypothetical protein WBD87_12085 [Candidatus Acidiferrales bacterium]
MSSHFGIHAGALAKIRGISHDASAAEKFFDKFVTSIGGTKIDSARTLTGGLVGGADYLFQNRIIGELKILEKDKWDEYNQKMDHLFAKYQADGSMRPEIDREKTCLDDPNIPDAMRAEWSSILLKQIRSIFREADRQIAHTKTLVPHAKGILLLLNIRNRLHAEPSRLLWLVRDNILSGASYSNIEAWAYFSLPVPELMSAGVNQSIFWGHFTGAENETLEGWKDQDLFMKCRGLREQWYDFLERELGLPINVIPDSEIQWPKP